MFVDGWREAGGQGTIDPPRHVSFCLGAVFEPSVACGGRSPTGDDVCVDELIQMAGAPITAAAMRVVLEWTHGGHAPTLDTSCALQSMQARPP